jgi:hypothetical protein
MKLPTYEVSGRAVLNRLADRELRPQERLPIELIVSGTTAKRRRTGACQSSQSWAARPRSHGRPRLS